MELILDEQVEEVVARSSKRPREYSDVDEGDGDTTEEVDVLGFRESCKKLCIEEAAAALCSTTIIPSVMELEDLEELQEQQQQQGGGSMATECCSNSRIISKEDAARVLRSLEEELGVSEEPSDDYASSSSSSLSSTPAAAASSSSAAQEALVDAAISSWSGEIIWNNSDHDGFVDTVEEDDEYDCVTAAAFSSGTSSLADEEEDRSAAQSGRSKGSDHHDLCTTALVDIVFLKEASDDELGIPPSPNTERFLDDGLMGSTQQQLHETSSMSVLSEAGALLEEAADGLSRAPESSSHDHDHHFHDAVSWALQEMCCVEEDSDWLLMPVTGSLDFLLDFSTGGYVPVAT
ncbi:unnamed protein product [Sphagnum troendelagicum]|uniref:Uncharacterized protein n=1 Tax=Sphagnum troendelagicum TaxID=128251 RepID=A0ABP0TWW0_9BRYO